MFFLFILIFLLIIIFAIHTSRIEIKIENLIIDTQKEKNEKVNKDNNIIISLIIFKKVKLFKKSIKKIKSIENVGKNKINYKNLLQNLKIDIKQIDLQIQLGTQDSALTAILTGIISGLLGTILRKPKYEVIPIYSDKNFLKIRLDCIISVYLMQYIYKLISDKIQNLINEKLNKKVEE